MCRGTKILVKAFEQNGYANEHLCQSLFSVAFCQRLCQKHFPAAATALLSPAAWCKGGSSRLHNGEQPDDDDDDDGGGDGDDAHQQESSSSAEQRIRVCQRVRLRTPGTLISIVSGY